MVFSLLFRSSPAGARALISPLFMHLRKTFRFASSGSHHNNSRPLSPSTPFRFFSSQTTAAMERGQESELLNKETTFGDENGKKSDQSNKGGGYTIADLVDDMIFSVIVIGFPSGLIPTGGYTKGLEEKNKERFDEFKLKVLEPGFVSKIVVNHSLALVYLNNNTEVPGTTEKGVYLLDINSPESFKEELEEAQKILRLDPVPMIDVTQKYPLNPRKRNSLPMC